MKIVYEIPRHFRYVCGKTYTEAVFELSIFLLILIKRVLTVWGIYLYEMFQRIVSASPNSSSASSPKPLHPFPMLESCIFVVRQPMYDALVSPLCAPHLSSPSTWIFRVRNLVVLGIC